jgi:hypothetical protein
MERSGPPRWRPSRWLLIGGLALAFTATLVAGVVIGSAVLPSYADGFSQQTPRQAYPTGVFGKAGARGGFQHGGALTVSNVGAQTITAKRADGTSVTIQTSSSTQYSRAGKSVDRSAITTGTQIRVKGTKNSDSSISATSIEIVLPSASGTVTKVSGGDITVQDRGGTSQTIHTSGSTTFTRADQSASLSAVTTGEHIAAVGTKNSDGSLNAEAVRIILPGAGGQITQISGSTITVQTRRGTQTIHVSSTTKYVSVTRGSNGPTESAATLGDLKVGSYIMAEGTKNSDGSLNAEVVRLLPAATKGARGWGGAPSAPPLGAEFITQG